MKSLSVRSSLSMLCSLLALVTFVPITANARCIAPEPPGLPSFEFCNKPPVVENLDLDAYTNGLWYQIAGSGTARLFGGTRCVTANYSFLRDGTIAALNCMHQTGAEEPDCVPALLTPRDNSTQAAELTQTIPSDRESLFNPGAFSVAAVVGNSSEGYDAAAVYVCAVQQPGFFIFTRRPRNNRKNMRILKRKLRCAGYNLEEVDFFPIEHPNDCMYFFGRQGSFNVDASG